MVLLKDLEKLKQDRAPFQARWSSITSEMENDLIIGYNSIIFILISLLSESWINFNNNNESVQ